MMFAIYEIEQKTNSRRRIMELSAVDRHRAFVKARYNLAATGNLLLGARLDAVPLHTYEPKD
tara:strand:- start:20107 stop:20292 length:186 start_codon:yes stop_codon:yes gene_type:complete